MIEYITQAIQKIINIIKTLDESMPSPTPLPTLPKCLSFSTLLFPSPTCLYALPNLSSALHSSTHWF